MLNVLIKTASSNLTDPSIRERTLKSIRGALVARVPPPPKPVGPRWVPKAV